MAASWFSATGAGSGTTVTRGPELSTAIHNVSATPVASAGTSHGRICHQARVGATGGSIRISAPSSA